MKKVTLKSIALCNFKGEPLRTTAFNPIETTIAGGNGLGKTRHFDAFIWLLFGKDAQDRKDYEIKTRINGNELHKCECSVTGVIDVDGEEITLRRAIVEDWVKPRGCADQVLKGNHTECWWNDTPVNVSEYDKRIQTIVDASVFKMITNPAFFANMKWQLQREQLFQLAGSITDEEIAEGNPKFTQLLDAISGKSLTDFRKELAARKKRLNAELKEIQPRIDQTQKMMPEAEDFEALDGQLANIDKEIADIDNAIANVNAAIRKQYEAEQAKQARVNDLTTKAQQILFSAKSKAQEAAFEANAARREKANAIIALKDDVKAKKNAASQAQIEMASISGKIERIKAEQDILRQDWYNENAKEYAGETTCPHCGQPLPEEMIAKAKEMYDKSKVKKMDEISAQGKELEGVVKAYEEKKNELMDYVSATSDEIGRMNDDIQRAQAELDAVKEMAVEQVDGANIPEWVELQKQIAEIRATISTDNSGVDTSALQASKKEWMTKRNDVSTRLANRDTIEKCKNEIADLEAHGKEIAQQIAFIEYDEYTMEQFSHAKIEECEKRINSKFKFVTFRLFDYTLDGNPVETCIPLIDGVPYGSANTASKMNAGLDIINALCEFYGVTAPIFIDNRESVNDIIPMKSQIINLVVTDDDKLTIK